MNIATEQFIKSDSEYSKIAYKKSVEQTSCEVVSCSASQEIPCLLCLLCFNRTRSSMSWDLQRLQTFWVLN